MSLGLASHNRKDFLGERLGAVGADTVCKSGRTVLNRSMIAVTRPANIHALLESTTTSDRDTDVSLPGGVAGKLVDHMVAIRAGLALHRFHALRIAQRQGKSTFFSPQFQKEEIVASRSFNSIGNLLS